MIYDLPPDEYLFLNTNDHKWPVNFREYFYFLTQISRIARKGRFELKIESLFHFLSLSSNMQLKGFGVTFHEGFGVVYY